MALGSLALCAMIAGCSSQPEPPPPGAREIAEEAKSKGPAEIPGLAVPPENKCGDLPGFGDYLRNLRTAAKIRSSEKLMKLLDPDILLDFGGGGGLAEFQERWMADPERQQQFWDELQQILVLGCAEQEGAAAIPYYFWSLPDNVDSFMAMIPLNAQVPLRKSPSDDAEIIGELHWNVLLAQVSDDPENADWHSVTTIAGDEEAVSGWVAARDVRSVLDYRAIFNRDDRGVWHMTAFIAGD
ncbi:MAG: hypothetical protein R3E02_04375 [Blastomonas sp.]